MSRQKKSGSTKKRDKRRRASGSPADSTSTQGTMGSLVGGFKRAIGTDEKRERTWKDTAMTAVLLAVVAAVLVWRFTQ
jgi:hypothetical protein